MSHKLITGWRIDHVYEDGSVADYQDDGTRQGRCLPTRRTRNEPHLAPLAIEHRRKCQCGYRVIENLDNLLSFINWYDKLVQEENLTPLEVSFGGHPHRKATAMVLSKVHGYGAIEQTYDPRDPDTTLRASQTRLLEVHVPTVHQGAEVPASIVQKIQDRYQVPVHRITGSIHDHQGDSILKERV